jgi:16S rRNA (guanine527-N7)-methyltransferase
MNAERTTFAEFLNDLSLAEPDKTLLRFDEYHTLLPEKNAQLNLFSRATRDAELWTKHFLDSLVPLKCVDFTGKKVLDFGSGGGLPGIPLKLAVPDCRMTLLDSVRKKCVAMQEMVAALELTDCEVVCSRMEDHLTHRGGYDLILCRAVRLEQRYLKPLRRLLASNGKVLFYKAQENEDISDFEPEELIRLDLDYGQRTIFSLERAQLTDY